ncbi:hypothetical protein [Winogradskyella sp. 3972H.M.0a.05]|uniref:hypothetical protein n=1 Tax=Winogradskyella sp. 3972H.M.0a.05 TaxID=2950277 RepID=UPI003398AAEC
MRIAKYFGHLIFILFLTVLTQVGGIVWLLSLYIAHKFKKKKRFVFPILYLVFSLAIIPPLASLAGREQLPLTRDELKPRNWIYPLLNRNYVTPELQKLLDDASTNLTKQGITITYLDASFPFIDGFSLLPHLSHNDGKKVDLSFMYKDKNGKLTNKKPSTSGYGTYVNKDNNQTNSYCKNSGYWQYDFPKYLTFGSRNDITFSKEHTRILIKELLSYHSTQKIFIEPYLKQSLGFENESKVKFHGCKAVRHDDHIHLQIK